MKRLCKSSNPANSGSRNRSRDLLLRTTATGFEPNPHRSLPVSILAVLLRAPVRHTAARSTLATMAPASAAACKVHCRCPHDRRTGAACRLRVDSAQISVILCLGGERVRQGSDEVRYAALDGAGVIGRSEAPPQARLDAARVHAGRPAPARATSIGEVRLSPGFVVWRQVKDREKRHKRFGPHQIKGTLDSDLFTNDSASMRCDEESSAPFVGHFRGT